MDTRARKRSDEEEQLPADKRACSSTDSKPSSNNATFSEASSSRPSTSTQDPLDVAMEDALPDDEPYNSDSDGASEEDEEYNYHEDGGHGGGNRDELKTTVTQLKESNDPGLQLAILTELCRLLCFCSRSRGADIASAAIPKLVELAGSGGPPDVVLMSVRALTYVFDLDPAFAPMLVKHGAIPIFCGRLLDIEYMDVAEQCLQALANVSVHLPVQCLHAGAVMACLTYIDFFPVSIQRVALLTVSNILKKLPSDCSSFLVETIPSLCSVVNSDDHKLVEIAITCLTRMTASSKVSAEVLDKLCKHGLVQKCANMISPLGGFALGQATYDDLIRLLANLASGSTEAVQILLEMNISTTLKDILTSNDVSHSTGSISVINSGCSDQVQVHEILKLLNQLIPSAVSRDKDTQSSIDKEKILMDQPRLLQQFSEDVIPALVQVANSGASLCICYGCASILNSLLLRDTSDKLLDILKGSNISSFLACLLTRKEQHVLFSALSIVDILLQKHPDVFSDLFVKEGIVCGIDKLLMVEKTNNDVTTQSNLAAHSSVSRSQKAVKKTSKCLCDSLDLCQRSPRKINCILEKSTVQTLVNKIKLTYLTLPSNAESGSTKILDKFKSFCCLLNDGVAKGKNEECLSQMVKQVISELCSVEHTSTFEFVESEVVKSLLNYLSNGQYLQAESDYQISLEHHVVVFNRLQAFANMVLLTNPPNQETTTLALLVQKLQSVLSSIEDFPVVASCPCKNKKYFAHIPFRGSTLHPCLKINFVKDEKEIVLSNYSYGIVNVYTSSSLYDIERCLWPSISPKLTKQSPNSTESTVGCTDCLNDNNADSGDCKVDESHPATKKELQRSDFSHSMREHAAIDLSPYEDANLEVRKLTIGNATTRDENGKSTASHSERDRKGNLVFYLEGKEIDQSLTLYQAILQHLLAVNAGLVVDPKFWNEVYTVSYKRAETQVGDSEMSCNVQERRQVSLCDQNLEDLSSMHQPLPSGFDTLSDLSRLSPEIPFLSSLLVARLPCKLEKSNPSYDILFMLKILEGLNRYSFHLLSNERSNSFGKERISEHQYLDLTKPYLSHAGFISVKLSKKLEQQMADSFTSSTGNMPAWCSQLVASCPFLFSFEARQKYFWLTTFSNSQSARNPYLQQSGSATSSFIDAYSHGTTTRIKFEVDRYQLLESAKKMMASHAHSRAALEVKYREEVGTGLGPTMEFYTLVSHEFQKIGLGLWRGDENSSNCVDCGFIDAPYGLFPRPWAALEMSSNEANFAEVVQKFTLLGKLVAKALQDRRVFYLPLSKAFYRSILGQILGIHDILSFDPDLGKTLLQLQSLAIRKRSMDEKGATSCNLLIQGTPLEDLCIDFTLPGYSDYVLTTGGNSIMVDQSNVTNYVSLVVDATVGSGVKRQMEAFKLGFNEVFPIQCLQMFTEDDLDLILCGEQDVWRIEELLENIKFDHGYTLNSVAAQNFIEIISEFQSDQQRAFLQFVTGAPRLPVGGLASLNPNLTVVRKHCSISQDLELPSAMTCANYLKLPAYSSKTNMREKLLYAITEGQGSFHLS